MVGIVPGDFPASPLPNFEAIKKYDENGIEYWYARDLMPLLEYKQWRSFEDVISKAKVACTNSGQDVENHFAETRKMVPLGSGSQREITDYHLDRYACYLIAQNADSAKPAVALAQTYFAFQSRRQELQDQLPEDQKRLFTRYQVVGQNKKLADTAQKHGVSRFGLFNDAGYLGLYGLTSKKIQDKKGVGKDHILDRAGTTELAANLFRITQTNDLLRKRLATRGPLGEIPAAKIHLHVGKQVRQSIVNIGGTLPEELPPQEHIKHVEKRVGKDIQDRLKDMSLEDAMKDAAQIESPEGELPSSDED